MDTLDVQMFGSQIQLQLYMSVQIEMISQLTTHTPRAESLGLLATTQLDRKSVV